ncbi:leucine zipper putative tumor suppressor 2 homolog isoform X2 [Gigantopelta aegis]|uniref:leucine zipper putative tumor suppressor 2 homolog isoform X2 n=1 Tax=Gigantopelta aegis TaxID=1735272 RepID=UPI001B88AE5B|nr:leucine zipper putative tumor suppressor 2 homolog isoform X2 [Gigantopelta aegis]
MAFLTNAGRSIVRPIAFKPVNGAVKTISPPRGAHRRMSNQDDGYGSHDYSHMTGNGTNLSHGSSHQDGSDRSTSFSSDFSRPVDRPESLPSLNMSRVSNNMEVFPVQTPSPSDSGVGELEILLREKDAEINTLRDVMDRNERAIFQVYEEKKSSWLRDVHEIREDYEKKFKIQQRKSYKTEQVLSLQVYKLQQEKRTLKDEYDKVYCEKEIAQKQCVSYEEEIRDLRVKLASYHNGKPPPPQLDEMTQLRQQVRDLNEEVCLKNREVLTLRTQLHNNDAEMEKKNKEIAEKFREILSKTEELKSLKNELGKLSAEEPEFRDTGVQCDCLVDPVVGVSSPRGVGSPQGVGGPAGIGGPRGVCSPQGVGGVPQGSSLVLGKDRTIVSLQEEVVKQRQELSEKQVVFDRDREQWLDEKNKVIRYQKQLQLNYVQMFRKNKMLEAEVEQLTLELESRDLKLMAMSGEESVC